MNYVPKLGKTGHLRREGRATCEPRGHSSLVIGYPVTSFPLHEDYNRVTNAHEIGDWQLEVAKGEHPSQIAKKRGSSK